MVTKSIPILLERARFMIVMGKPTVPME